MSSPLKMEYNRLSVCCSDYILFDEPNRILFYFCSMWIGSWLYWIAQTVGWGLFGTFLFMTVYISSEEGIITNDVYKVLTSLSLSIGLSHLLRFIYIRFNWLNQKFLPILLRVLVACIITAILYCSVYWTIRYSLFFRENDNYTKGSFFFMSTIYLIVFLLWSILYITYHLVQKSRNQEIDNLQLVASNSEIELKNLREQLNPHFLFNSLNSIRALIDIEPKIAKKSVTTLSSLLRSSLQMGKKNLIPLEAELSLCKEYLELEKIRFEERLRISWDIDVLSKFEVPPFIIQTQVENAIKHGISKIENGGDICIMAFEENKVLTVRVKNTGSLSLGVTNGIGITNTIRRLQIQFKEKAKFELIEDKNKIIAEIVINFN